MVHQIFGFARLLQSERQNLSAAQPGAFDLACCERQYPICFTAAPGNACRTLASIKACAVGAGLFGNPRYPDNL
jgi:hypothetical protein